MEFKKNIVLTSLDSNSPQKAVLSYLKQNNNYKFEFKGINFLPKERLLGVYINNKLYKYNLNSKNLVFDVSINENVDNVSVVVLDKQNMLKPFLWGSQLITDTDYILNKVIEEVNIKTIKESNYKEDLSFDNDAYNPSNVNMNSKILHNETNNNIYSNINTKVTSNNEYNETVENDSANILSDIDNRQNQEQSGNDSIEINNKNVFSLIDNLTDFDEKYNQILTRESKLQDEEKEINELLDSYQNVFEAEKEQRNSNLEFYSMISAQVEKMLKENETEKILQDIIPDSKFVQVPKANGECYIFGVIYENEIPKYLCYGERGKFSEERPEHLKAYYQWLPIDVDNVSGEGYFMMYQDAKTGKNLEMTII